MPQSIYQLLQSSGIVLRQVDHSPGAKILRYIARGKQGRDEVDISPIEPG
jgi:hypothetical protein